MMQLLPRFGKVSAEAAVPGESKGMPIDSCTFLVDL